MSGMDRLTINDLEYWEEYGDYDVKLMARELLAHRRASQAAPAPIYHGDLSILPDTEDKFRDMVCATAPSDALRGLVACRILDDAISSVEDDMRADLEDAEDTGEHVDVGQYEVVLSYETAQTIRAALSTPTEERQ